MKKTLLIIVLVLFPLVYGLEECFREMNPRQVPCNVISSWIPSDGCDVNVSIYNSTGDLILNASYGAYTPVCNFTWNISDVGTYHYNSTIESGVVTINGEEENMILGVMLFLIGINLLLFALPFWVRFSESEAGNFVVRRLMWVASILLLWFNTTLFRQLAVDWGLGIDDFLEVYWWIFTLGAFASVFIMCYIMVVGAVKLMKESQMKKRMGDSY